jgi:hypothetical protein
MDHGTDALCDNPRTVTRGCDSQTQTGGQIGATAELVDSVGVHWLRGTVMETDQSWLVETFCRLFGEEFDELEHGFWGYDRHVRWPSGAMVLYHSTATGLELMKGRIALEIPGRALEALDAWDILMLAVNLRAHQFKCTRIDLYFDDSERIITPGKLYETVYEPSLFDKPIRADFTGFQVIKQIREGHKSRGITHDEVAFGRRGAVGCGKYMRAYDKRLESEGKNPAIRYELELSDDKAEQAFWAIVQTCSADWRPAKTASVIGAMIGGSIDFKIRTGRTGDKNLCRLKRHEWWQRIIDKIGRAKLDGKKHEKTVEKARTWVSKQCAGTLQMLHGALGAEVFLPFIVEVCTSGDRLRGEHLNAIAEYRRRIEGQAEIDVSGLRSYCDATGVPLEGE